MLNWGLAGLGDISGKRVAPAIASLEQSRLYAVMSPYEEEVSRFKNRFNTEKGYLDINDMTADENIDVIYVATPVYLHYEIAAKALSAGKHVIVEKPMALSNDECTTLIDIAKSKNVKFAVAYYRRFFPKMSEIKRLIKDGTIGDIILVRINFNTWYSPEKNDPKYWRVIKKKAGGGPLWDMGAHKFDMMIDLCGMPKQVSCVMDTLTHDYEVEDSFSAVMKLENNAHCVATFNWNSKVWTDEFEILGTEGKIVLKPCDSESMEVHLNPKIVKGMGSEITTVLKFNHPNVHYPMIKDFENAVLNDERPTVDAEEGYKTNRILEALERSAETKKTIIL